MEIQAQQDPLCRVVFQAISLDSRLVQANLVDRYSSLQVLSAPDMLASDLSEVMFSFQSLSTVIQTGFGQARPSASLWR